MRCLELSTRGVVYGKRSVKVSPFFARTGCESENAVGTDVGVVLFYFTCCDVGRPERVDRAETGERRCAGTREKNNNTENRKKTCRMEAIAKKNHDRRNENKKTTHKPDKTRIVKSQTMNREEATDMNMLHVTVCIRVRVSIASEYCTFTTVVDGRSYTEVIKNIGILSS